MKKIISSILIAIVVLQLFAPFSVGLDNKKLAINKNQAEAADCIVNSVSFTPAGGLSKDTTTSLPSSIIATINTHDCVNKKVIFEVLESFNYSDEEVFQKTVIASNDTMELKLSPTELKCGSNDLCGFKYRIATENGSFAWKSPNDISVNYFYKCTSKDTNGKLVCSNNSPWTGTISSGATDPEIEVPDINFKIKMTGAVTNIDKTVTATMSVTDTTDYTQLGIAGNITYSYYLNVFVKNEAGTKVAEKRVFYSKINSTINPVTLDILPSTKYTLDGSIDVVTTTQITGIVGSSTTDKTYPEVAKLDAPLSFTSNKEGNTTINKTGNISASAEHVVNTGSLPACGLGLAVGSTGTIMGCVAQGIYYVFFVPTSALFALTGKALDVSLMFSISDASYRSSFVTEGWGIVRDFCNMFFIFVMLYIAIGTILNLSGVKTKEMIVNVVIIGLLINFSLLATQIIIDTSNILTRVFYNQSTIATGIAIKDANGNITSVENNLGDFGEIKLSEAIVSKVDPQKLILEAQKVSALPIRGQANNEDQAPTSQGITTGSFIWITLLATAVNIFGIIAFFSCAIIFVARVVGLWLAMILAPLAFFSYTVPALQGVESIGWKHWWPETLKLAFLAPIFAFFMYIIVAFLGKGLDLINADGKTGLGFVVAIVLPFIFIMVLLTKAKDMAKSMSGEIGKTMTKVGESVGKFAVNTVGGAVGGAALGLGASALRGTVGKAGNALFNSEKLKLAQKKGGIAGFGAKTLRNIGNTAGTGSMDIRATKLGASAISKTGMDMGKAKEGGYKKYAADKVEKKQKIAESLEVGENEPLKQSVNKTEIDLQALLTANKAEMDNLDKLIEIKRQALADANAQFGGNSIQSTTAGFDLQNAKNKKKALRDGAVYTGDLNSTGVQTAAGTKDYSYVKAAGTYSYVDENGATQTVDRTISNIELFELKHGKQKIEDENRKRRTDYANNTFKNWGSNINREARHKIIMGSKVETKK